MNPEEMNAGRELDAAIAEKIIGLTIVAHDWPCGRDPDQCQYSAAYFFTDEAHNAMWYQDRGPVYVPEHGGVWPPQEMQRPLGLPSLPYAQVTPIPFYSTDIAAAWLVIETMQRRGYWCQMRTPFDAPANFQPGAVWTEPDGYWAGFTPHGTTGWNGRPDFWTQAPSLPVAICRAALATIAAESVPPGTV